MQQQQRAARLHSSACQTTEAFTKNKLVGCKALLNTSADACMMKQPVWLVRGRWHPCELCACVCCQAVSAAC